jgi:hypothetical protein
VEERKEPFLRQWQLQIPETGLIRASVSEISEDKVCCDKTVASNTLHVHVGVSKVSVSSKEQDYFIHGDRLSSSFCHGMVQQLPHHHFRIKQNQLTHPEVQATILLQNVNTFNHYTMQQSNSLSSFKQKRSMKT